MISDDLTARAAAHFDESIAVKEKSRQTLPESVAAAGRKMADTLAAGGKILACGNGGSAADAQHFAAELVGRFERERRELPAMALTTDSSILTAVANDYDFSQIFSKQVKALGQKGDVLLAISTSGNSGNVMQAVRAAQAKEMTVIALTGRGGGAMVQALRENDILLNVPAQRTARIQEVHILMIHAMCDIADFLLFGANG